MANKNISDLTAASSVLLSELLEIQQAAGNRKLTLQQLMDAIGQESIVVLQDDVVNNDAVANTLKDCTGLEFSGLAGESFYVYAFIHFGSAAAGNGSRWVLDGPAVGLITYRSSLSSAAATMNTQNANAYNLPAASIATSAYTTGNYVVVEGTIKLSADGTVKIRFASEGSGLAITAKADVSFISYYKLP